MYGYKVDILYSYIFNKSNIIFNDYIDKFYSIKSETKDPTIKYISKLMLNTLYDYEFLYLRFSILIYLFNLIKISI